MSKEYEAVIDESNLVTRTDLDGKIIYANNAFIDASGFSKEELLGQTHELIRSPDTDSKKLQEVWQTIQSGKLWKGLFKNIRKNNQAFWLNTVIYPIHDTKNEIKEYMSIYNEVTEIIELHQEIENTQKELIYRMGEVAESRSKETGNHIKRVAFYSKLLAEKYGLAEDECELIFTASPMHDIGKLSTPDSILNKPGKLTDEEWRIMQEHTTTGYDLLKSSDKKILRACSYNCISSS